MILMCLPKRISIKLPGVNEGEHSILTVGRYTSQQMDLSSMAMDLWDGAIWSSTIS